MPMASEINVAVAVLFDARGRVLLAQRPPEKAYGGWWEFPGGKVEAGESVADALARELAEELGIVVSASAAWLIRRHRYPHAQVLLWIRRVDARLGHWSGQPVGREGQAFVWCTPPLARGPQLRAPDLPQPLLPATELLLDWLNY